MCYSARAWDSLLGTQQCLFRDNNQLKTTFNSEAENHSKTIVYPKTIVKLYSWMALPFLQVRMMVDNVWLA